MTSNHESKMYFFNNYFATLASGFDFYVFFPAQDEKAMIFFFLSYEWGIKHSFSTTRQIFRPEPSIYTSCNFLAVHFATQATLMFDVEWKAMSNLGFAFDFCPKF